MLRYIGNVHRKAHHGLAEIAQAFHATFCARLTTLSPFTNKNYI